MKPEDQGVGPAYPYRYAEQYTPPEPKRVSDVALTTFEHVFEVDPRLMQRWVLQQTFPNWDSLRIMNSRHDHLEWMHRHFADNVINGSSLLAELEAEIVRPRCRPNPPPASDSGPKQIESQRFSPRPARRPTVKFSYVMLPDYPLVDSLESIRLADELGFYAVYAADETWHKDLWLLFAAAAAQTKQVRFGPSVSAVTLREPTLIAQAAATLDELTDGRAEVVLSSGNFGLLAQYNIDWKNTKPLSRVKEGIHVIRTFLDDGAITFDGDFFSYKGLFTFARPVQEHLPLKMGAMRGPKSFQLSAEISDGCHQALGYTREAYQYMYDNMAIGAKKAGKNVDDLDIGAWMSFAVGEDSAIAKEAAASMVGLYASSMPDELLHATASRPSSLPRCSRPWAPVILPGPSRPPRRRPRRNSPSPALRKRSLPSCKDIADVGVNHMILAITDAGMVKA